jgi:hypothetical protein
MLLLLAAAFAGTLDQAVEARRAGDYAGATALLDALHPLVEPEEEGLWQYERGMVEDLTWNPDKAEPYYRAAVAFGGDIGVEARYRLVVVLDDMGRYPEAREELQALRSVPTLNPEFLPVLRIEAGVLALREGRPQLGAHLVTSGIRGVADPQRHSWMIGRGRAAVLDARADAAEALELSGRERRVVRNLKKRARTLAAVEAELYAVIATKEPEWITLSLLRVGDTYAALADDLARSGPPPSLSPEQAELYRELITEKSEGPRTKAFNLYDHGVLFAARTDWESPAVKALRERRDALAEVR